MKRNSAIVPCTECVYAETQNTVGQWVGLCRKRTPGVVGGAIREAIWPSVCKLDGCGEGKREGKKGKP